MRLSTWAGKTTPWLTLQERPSKPRGMESEGKTGGKFGNTGVWKIVRKGLGGWEDSRYKEVGGCGGPVPAATEEAPLL